MLTLPDALPRSFSAAVTVRGLHRRPAQGRAARAPRRVGLAADRRRAGRPAPGAPASRPTRPSSPSTSPSLDFGHFIEVYLSVVDLITDAEDVRTLTYEVARDMTAHNIRYAELTVHAVLVDPSRDPGRGVRARRSRTPGIAAERELGIVLRWCFDIPGEAGLAAAELTAGVATELRRPAWSASVSAVRRSGCRAAPVPAATSTGPARPGCTACRTPARPPARRRSGTPSATARRRADRPRHLGDAGPGAAGLPGRAPDRPRGLPDLQHRHPRGADLAEHPLPAMVAAGVPVTINSDDPPMFSTDLNREYAIAAELLGLDQAGIAELARNAVTASFAPDEVKAAAAGRDRRLADPRRRNALTRGAGRARTTSGTGPSADPAGGWREVSRRALPRVTVTVWLARRRRCSRPDLVAGVVASPSGADSAVALATAVAVHRGDGVTGERVRPWPRAEPTTTPAIVAAAGAPGAAPRTAARRGTPGSRCGWCWSRCRTRSARRSRWPWRSGSRSRWCGAASDRARTRRRCRCR